MENVYVRAMTEAGIKFTDEGLNNPAQLKTMLSMVSRLDSELWRTVRNTLANKLSEHQETAKQLRELANKPPSRAAWRNVYFMEWIAEMAPALVIFGGDILIYMGTFLTSLQSAPIPAMAMVLIPFNVMGVLFVIFSFPEAKRRAAEKLKKNAEKEAQYKAACQKCELYEKAIRVLDNHVSHLKVENTPE